MAPAPETPAQIATACARRSSGEASTRAERVAGITAAVPTPARPRSAMWVPGCSTSPDASDATANKARPATRNCRRPHRSAAIPTGSSKAAKTRARRSPPTSARSAWPRCSRRCPVARARGRRRTDHQSEGHTHRRQQAVRPTAYGRRRTGGEVVTDILKYKASVSGTATRGLGCSVGPRREVPFCDAIRSR